MALIAKHVEGVAGGINFAGGSGGNPDQRPEQPCSEPALARLYADYGQTARSPTLWLYSVNDRYWGPQNPRRWFDGFRNAGGVGEFLELPAHGHDGHASLVENATAWKPHLERFLGALGF